MKKLGSLETWFGREVDHGFCSREGAAVSEKRSDKLQHGEAHRENKPQQQLDWKAREAKFHEFSSPVGLTA